MANYLWIFWTILGAILIIAEVFTTGFVLLWFGIGALAAALAGLLGIHSIPLQFLIFAIVSIALTTASRTIFVNYFSRRRVADPRPHGLFAGKDWHRGIVKPRGDERGAVKVFGSTWTAYPADGEEVLRAGDRVAKSSASLARASMLRPSR